MIGVLAVHFTDHTHARVMAVISYIHACIHFLETVLCSELVKKQKPTLL